MRKAVFGVLTRSDTNRDVGPQKMAMACNFGFRKQKDCTIQAAKTKTLIGFPVTVKLICVFVFAFAKIWVSHVAADIMWQWFCGEISIFYNCEIPTLIYPVFTICKVQILSYFCTETFQ